MAQQIPLVETQQAVDLAVVVQLTAQPMDLETLVDIHL
jgi:hypothetical protein